MQGAVTQGRQIHQRGVVVNRLQGKSQIDGNGGRAAAAFGIHDGEHLAPGIFPPWLAASRGQANEGFQEIGGGGGALDVFAHTRPHGIHNQLRLRHGADCEQRRIGKFLVQQLHGA